MTSNKDIKNIKNIKPKDVFNMIINNEYITNLIYDRYIHTGTYKSVYEYIQSDDKCSEICNRYFNKEEIVDIDEILINQLVNIKLINNKNTEINKIISIDVL